jgi:hypothetical protein
MSAYTGELPIHGWHGRSTRRTPSLTTALLAASLVVAMLCAASAWRLVAGARETATVAPAARAGVITSFGYRASHAKRYHAEVVSAPSPAVGETQRWIVRLTRHDHRRLAGAHVSADVWMPETGARAPVRPTVSYVGGGRYAVDGVQLSQPGWWNVALVIAGRAGTDSVAFNAVLP